MANVPTMPAIAGSESSNIIRATGALIAPSEAAANVPPTRITNTSAKPTRDAARQWKYVPTAHPPNKTVRTENTVAPVCQSAKPFKAITAAAAKAPRAMSASQLAPMRVRTRAACNFLTGIQGDATVDIGCALGGAVHLAFASSFAAGRDDCGSDPAGGAWTERTTSSIARSLAAKASIQ